jgi:hypothetical protein
MKVIEYKFYIILIDNISLLHYMDFTLHRRLK